MPIRLLSAVCEHSVPDKGKILTQISAFWFDKLKSIVPNHMLALGTAILPHLPNSTRDVIGAVSSAAVATATVFGLPTTAASGALATTEDWLNRSMVVQRLDMLPLEVVVRYVRSKSCIAHRSLFL